MDKPEQIRIQGKGTIRITYDADGSKLQRTYTPDAGGSKTTTYINGYVYEQLVSSTGVDGGLNLQFFGFEEGRIRVVHPTNTGNYLPTGGALDIVYMSGTMDLPNIVNGAAFDFFVRDQQQNTRMVLTEEINKTLATCTLEKNRVAIEDPLFGQVDNNGKPTANNEAEITKIPTPLSWSANTTGFVTKLGNRAGHNLGPNMLQKVMAGDEITATVLYNHQANPTNGNNSILSSILSSLGQAFMGTSAVTASLHGGTGITNGLNNSNFSGVLQPPTSAGIPNAPQAYLTILFFDERFNLVSEQNGGVFRAQVDVALTGTSSGATRLLPLTSEKAPKNGYVYVYLSNMSDQDVLFDDLAVTNVSGRIIEEDHYYSYGLKITGISSKKLDVGIEGHLANGYQYQGAFNELDEDLGWNDFALRSYDPQIGRWLQMDPYDQFASGYVGMGCDPVNNVDPSGGFVDPIRIVTTSMNASGGIDAVITMARIAPQLSRVVGLGARVFATVATQVTRYVYSNATSELTTSTDHHGSFIDKESNEQMNPQGTRTETYFQQVDVTGQYLQAQKAAMEKAIALDKLNSDFAKLHAFTLAWDGGSTKMYRNAVGETRTTGMPESLGDDLVGQAFGYYAMGGGFGGFGRGAVGEELGEAGALLADGEGGGKMFFSKAPMSVEPGITRLEGQHLSDIGHIQPWKASYDKFGRLVERTDWNAANSTYNIEAIHHHLFEYLPKLQMKSIDHIPGIGPTTGW